MQFGEELEEGKRFRSMMKNWQREGNESQKSPAEVLNRYRKHFLKWKQTCARNRAQSSGREPRGNFAMGSFSLARLQSFLVDLKPCQKRSPVAHQSRQQHQERIENMESEKLPHNEISQHCCK